MKLKVERLEDLDQVLYKCPICNTPIVVKTLRPKRNYHAVGECYHLRPIYLSPSMLLQMYLNGERLPETVTCWKISRHDDVYLCIERR